VSHRLAYRERDAADMVSLGLTKFREEVAAGRIEVVRAGRAVLVPHDSLVAYVELQRSESAAPSLAIVDAEVSE